MEHAKKQMIDMLTDGARVVPYEELVEKLVNGDAAELCYENYELTVTVDENGLLHSESENVPAVMAEHGEIECFIVHHNHGEMFTGNYPAMMYINDARVENTFVIGDEIFTLSTIGTGKTLKKQSPFGTSIRYANDYSLVSRFGGPVAEWPLNNFKFAD